jgi:molybdopterin-containing oxidoreductase family iron-sulfur binding subunit
MAHDQCHSTLHETDVPAMPTKEELASTPRQLQRMSGQKVWRSAEEIADAPQFRDELEREFQPAMGELVGRRTVDLSAAYAGVLLEREEDARDAEKNGSRRDFLKIMGASAALAGAVATMPGCRRPEQKIHTYSKTVPEDIIAGKPLYYVTSMPRPDGGAEGLMVETHEGRPTKIEGNPLHSVNQGKSTQWSIASIMGLYDPDRLKQPVYANPAQGRVDASWDDFRTWASDHFKGLEGEASSGLYVLADKVSSPTRDAMLAAFRARYPKAVILHYAPGTNPAGFEGTKLAFGAPMREALGISKENTKVIVSLDRDFLHNDPQELIAARQFAAARFVGSASDEMVRLYAIESGLSATGASADHRLRLAPSRVTAFAIELAKFVLPKLGDAKFEPLLTALASVTIEAGEDLDKLYIEEIGRDLLDGGNRGKTLVLAGGTQPAIVHAIAAALNSALGNVGASVSYYPATEVEAASSNAAIETLASDMAAGKVRTLLCLNTNPLHTAPGDLGAGVRGPTGKGKSFAELFKDVPATITLSVQQTETEGASTWSLNGAHALESWGDTRALDGTIAPIQPMIAPLYEPAMSDIELLALLTLADKTAKVDGYELVRTAWKTTLGTSLLKGGFEQAWRRALHDGVVAGTQQAPTAPKTLAIAEIAKAVKGFALPKAPTNTSLEVAFQVGKLADGRYANVSWLHELPEIGTRCVWDNPVLMSPRTAVQLGVAPLGFKMDPAGSVAMDKPSKTNPLNAMYTDPTYPTAKVVEIRVGERTIKAPAWICPGVADNTLVCTIGYGRERAGLVGDGVGVNVAPLMDVRGGWSASGATLKDTGDTFLIASTQNHWTLDGKQPVLRFVDLPAWKKHGDAVQTIADSFYPDNKHTLNFAERIGELSHTPPNLSIRVNPYGGSRTETPDPTKLTPGDPNGPRYQRNQPPAFTERPQWGMTIDSTTCTGCGVCIVACQSENNIPVVGKKETAKGRELHWIRVDRYFTGDDFNNPSGVHHQPVACVHCENAPCEVVCPVNATVHGPEGLNYMTYNRCIGTRYCANNCPYKVRRYNWFDYGVTKFNGGYYGKELVETVAPDLGGITGSGQHNKINPNLIPPRLRQKLDEISRMQKNPDVTVRSRGVMEKCSYCIQRINAAKIDCKLADIKDKDGNYVVPDGFFQTSCQQACPSNAIVFGDILDSASKVSQSRKNARGFALLGYLNTRPRTSHLLRVSNPNLNILKAREPERFAHVDSPFHGPEGDGHDGHGHDHHDGGKHDAPHGPETGSEKKVSYFDTRKQRSDTGYALSLRVLSSTGGMA